MYMYVCIYIYIYIQCIYIYTFLNIFIINLINWKALCYSHFTVRSKKIVTVASCGFLSNKHQNKIGFTYSVNQNVAKNLLNFILTSNREYSYCKRCQISSSRWKYTHWICSWQRTCANQVHWFVFIFSNYHLLSDMSFKWNNNPSYWIQ